MPRPLLAVLAAAVALAVIAGIAGWRTFGDDGRISVQRPVVTVTMHPMKLGASFSMGGMPLEGLQGDVEILEVRPITSPNVEYLGATVVLPREQIGNMASADTVFPPADQPAHRPALGWRIPHAELEYVYPDGSQVEGLVLTTGFRIVSGDLGAVNGVIVVYRDGGKTKRHLFRHAAVGCIKPHPCESAEKKPKVDFADQVLFSFGLIPRPSGLDR